MSQPSSSDASSLAQRQQVSCYEADGCERLSLQREVHTADSRDEQMRKLGDWIMQRYELRRWRWRRSEMLLRRLTPLLLRYRLKEVAA